MGGHRESDINNSNGMKALEPNYCMRLARTYILRVYPQDYPYDYCSVIMLKAKNVTHAATHTQYNGSFIHIYTYVYALLILSYPTLSFS